MIVINILYFACVLSYIFILPGYLVTRRHIKEAKGLIEIIALSLAIGIVLIGTFGILSALLFNTLVSKILIFSISTLIIILYSKNIFTRMRKPTKKTLYLLIFFIFIFSFHLIRYDVRLFEWNNGCLNAAIDKIIGAHETISVDGRVYNDFTTREFNTSPKILENIIKNDRSAIEDQRLGNSAIISPFVVLFNRFGFRLFYAILTLLVSLLFYLQLNFIFKKEFVSILGATIITFNPFVLSFPFITEGLISLMLALLLTYLLLKEKFFLSGFVFGMLYGSRDAAILFIPAIIYYIGIKNYKNLRNFFLSLFISISPYLYWHYLAFGTIFVTDTITESNMVIHNFWGINFNYPGLLNFPFYPLIVRTIIHPFPAFIIIPLTLIRHFGILFIALFVVGLSSLYKKNKRLANFFLIWSVPYLLLLLIQANWLEYNKITYTTLILNPLCFFMIGGLFQFIFRKNIRKNLLLLVAILLIISVSIVGIKNFNFKVDPRTRLQYGFSEKDELYNVVEYEREVYTKINFFPDYSLANKHSNVFRPHQLKDFILDLSNKDYDLEKEKLDFKQDAKRIKIDFSKDLFQSKDWAYLSNSGSLVGLKNNSKILLRDVNFKAFNKTYDIIVSSEPYLQLYINPPDEDISNLNISVYKTKDILFDIEKGPYTVIRYNALQKDPKIVYEWYLYTKGEEIIIDGPKVAFWV